jgi:hypothetical protein
MPVGTNLPILAAAMESIMEGWYKYNKSKSQGAYIKDDEFKVLLKDEIDSIRIKLKDMPYGDKVVKAILRTNKFGIMERYRVFFEEIGLSIDDNEWKAISGRHKFVHGKISFAETNWELTTQHVDILETLLHKILLKLLGYTGNYIDRSILGWNDKRLD